MERYNLKNIYPFWGLILFLCGTLCVYIFLIGKKKGNNTNIYSLDNANFIKSVSAIGLIFHHYVQVMPTSSVVEELFRDMIGGIGYMFSAIFLFSSGYGLAQKTICWKDFCKRIMKLYIPYVITSFLIDVLTESGGGYNGSQANYNVLCCY